MTQARLRLSVFGLWVTFWIVSTVVMFVSPWLRHDIERADILPAVFAIAAIWIPPLSCLAAFWFPRETQAKAGRTRASKDKIAGALAITATYLLFVLGLIVYSTFFVRANLETENPGSITLLGQLNESIKIALLVSPVALAPINWLTGGINSRE